MAALRWDIPAAMSHSTAGRGRRRAGVTITEADITSSSYYSWEEVGEVTDEIRRRNKGRSEEDKLSTTGTKSDMIRTLLVDDGKGIRRGGKSGKPSARGLQKRTGRGAGTRSSGSAGTTKSRTVTKDDNNKENVGPTRRTTRSSRKATASAATTKTKPAAAGTKKADANGEAARAGDVILVANDDKKEERAEVLEIDPRTGMAKLCFEKTVMEATEVKLSELTYTVEDKYAEPVPQNQVLPSYEDVAPDAPRYKPDDPEMLWKLMSGPMTLQSYDENLL